MTAVETIEAVQGVLHKFFPSVEADGDIGPASRAALKALPDPEARREIQALIDPLFPSVKPDGVFGPLTFSALALLDEMGDHESLAEIVQEGQHQLVLPGDGFQVVKASSFADPADVAAFRQCKANGGGDVACFAKGDNGRGAWGADCTALRPMVALPREIWRAAGKRGGAMVEIEFAQAIHFTAELGDTMPALKNIRNGAGMDCNPAAVAKLGKRPPMMLEGVRWRWARMD